MTRARRQHIIRHQPTEGIPNDVLFAEYYAAMEFSKSPKYAHEVKAFLEKFRRQLGDDPPDRSRAVAFLENYRSRSVNTRTTYLGYLSGFCRYVGVPPIDLGIRVPSPLPAYVGPDDIARLVEAIKGRRTHRKFIFRDLLILETACRTGLRRAEIANLTIRDLYLNTDPPFIRVTCGKGCKDRSVPIDRDLRRRLTKYLLTKRPSRTIFGLNAKSLSGKIRQWADRAGLPHIHFHSLRHFAGTALFQRGANPRAIQALLGHASLETTMRYSAVTASNLKETTALLNWPHEGVKPPRANHVAYIKSCQSETSIKPAPRSAAEQYHHCGEMADTARKLVHNLGIYQYYGIVREERIGDLILLEEHVSQIDLIDTALSSELLQHAQSELRELRPLETWGSLTVEGINPRLIELLERMASGAVPPGECAWCRGEVERVITAVQEAVVAEAPVGAGVEAEDTVNEPDGLTVATVMA